MAKGLLTNSGGLDTSTLTATSAQVLTGYTGGVKDIDEPVAGTMPNRGAPTTTLNCSGVYNIAVGYHSGGKITANTLAAQTPTNSNAHYLPVGHYMWGNGAQIVGTGGWGNEMHQAGVAAGMAGRSRFASGAITLPEMRFVNYGGSSIPISYNPGFQPSLLFVVCSTFWGQLRHENQMPLIGQKYIALSNVSPILQLDQNNAHQWTYGLEGITTSGFNIYKRTSAGGAANSNDRIAEIVYWYAIA